MSSRSSLRYKNRCFTSFKRFECVNHWIIKSFKRSCEGMGYSGYKQIISSPFTVDLDGKLSWALIISKHDGIDRYYPYRLNLRLISDEASRSSPIGAFYSLTIERRNGDKCSKDNGCHYMSAGQEHTVLLFDTGSFQYDGKRKYLEAEEDITIKFELLVSGEKLDWSYRLPAYPMNEVPQLELDLLKLLEKGEFSDVTIETNGVSFKAHKAILAARSEYFRAMFAHNTIEAATSHVKMSDIEPEVMRTMLRSIYSGNVNPKLSEEKSIKEGEEQEKQGNENNQSRDGKDNVTDTKIQDFYHKNSSVIDLLKNANKYQIDDLKTNCEFLLSDHISLDHALDLLELSHIYRAANLKDQVIKFMIVHAKDLHKSKRLCELTKKYPDLSRDLFEVMFEAKASGCDFPATRVTFKSGTFYEN